ncbi:MAG: PHP domain-containing protein [Candidatus Aminicenantes bacterium]|nr:PHP domain-containing protein [Candidatus Aminicenantes bacterium]
MLKVVRADLHIHTCLSPCADLSMSPRRIAAQAKEKSIEIIGISDHNSAENVPALIEAARPYSIKVIPGIEVTTKEEVHLLALFANLELAINFQEEIYTHLPGENDPNLFGWQIVANEKDEVLDFNPRLLLGATTLSLEETIDLIHAGGGLVIASHIDREGFSLLGQLGFIPFGLPLDALEISPRLNFEEAKKRFNYDYPLVTFSDAHKLEEIGTVTTSLLVKDLVFEEIALAIKGQAGRRILN